MTDLAYRFDRFTPLVLILVFFVAFLSAAESESYIADIDLELSMSDDQVWVWVWNEDQANHEPTKHEPKSISKLDVITPIIKAEASSIISFGKKSNISKTLPSIAVSLLSKGKSSTVVLKDKFNKLVAKNSKLKTTTLKPTKKKSKVNNKKKVANTKLARKIQSKAKNKKYDIFASSSSWKPKTRKLVKIYKKASNSGKLSQKALTKAFKYYEKHKSHRGLSDKYLVVADYTKSSKSKRMHLINLKNGKIASYLVAHGKRSGPVGGRVHSTSNRRNSHMTSKGFFKVGYKEGRTLKKGYKYLSVTGLERGNRKVGLPTRHGGRDVVIHTASYVNSGGRSFGCFAIRPQDKKRVFGKIKGALFYSYAG